MAGYTSNRTEKKHCGPSCRKWGGGAGLVVFNKEDHYEEMARILRDNTTYQKLRSNPSFKLTLKEFVKKGYDQNILNLKEKRYFVSEAT